MIDSISIFALFVALTLPWLCGCIWVAWLLRRTGRCNAFMVLGHGFFLGTFFNTLIMRLWDVLGLTLNFWGIAAAVFILGIVGIVLQFLRLAPVVKTVIRDAAPRWHIALGTALIALIAWRHVTLLQELLLRPLYAWDAWMNWAPKAIVWFHQGSLVDFLTPDEWLLPGSEAAYTLGNRQASDYPITVPLIQLWVMLAIGTWDHSVVYLPWLLAPLAMGLGLYGHLRVAGVPYLAATIACYLLLSLPYLNVHSVLAGYADIWVACAFGLAVCALYEWRLSRHWAYALLLLALALLCAQLKEPGMILALILIVFGARVWLDVRPTWVLAIASFAGSLLALVLFFGVSMDVPYLGHLVVDGGTIELGKVGRIELEYHNVMSSFIETFFVMINWHLLWYLVIPCVLFRIYQGRVVRLPPDEVLALLAAFGFVFAIFVFSKYFVAALNFVTLNRVLLYPIPAMIFCIFLSFQSRVSQSLTSGEPAQ